MCSANSLCIIVTVVAEIGQQEVEIGKDTDGGYVEMTSKR